MTMAMQGKCTDCKVRWEFEKGLKLDKCKCPDCGKQLEQTSYHLKWPTRYALVLYNKYLVREHPKP